MWSFPEREVETSLLDIDLILVLDRGVTVTSFGKLCQCSIPAVRKPNHILFQGLFLSNVQLSAVEYAHVSIGGKNSLPDIFSMCEYMKCNI